jgi:opacity protein-like surface antigen
MRKIVLSLLLFLGGSSLNATNVFNSNKAYVGVGGTLISTGRRGDVNLFKKQIGQDRALGATLLVGYSIRDFLDIEARYSQSVSKDDDFKQKTWGIFLKPKYTIFNNLSIYGLYGIGGVKVTPKKSNVDFSVTDISLGGGANYKISSNISLFADYVDYARHNLKNFKGKTQQVDTKSITTGIIYNF